MVNKPYVDIYSGLLLEDKGTVEGTTITYTASEPIDIKNHNFNLKIDNQTLQVNASGQLCANLDELGNEVNSIADDVATLEADMATAKTDITNIQNTYLTKNNLPTATTTQLGVIKADGETITVTSDGKITAVGTASNVERYGIHGDYATQYGILECPNGILTVSGMKVTLQPSVVMQCAGQEAKTLIASPLEYTVTSTSDVDLFYVSGLGIIECGNVFYQETEPQNGTENYVAWWKPSLGKWQFKSNDSGNVFREAVACRLAHIHTNGIHITRVDYIGNRILDDEIFALQSDVDTALEDKANKTDLPVDTRLLKGTSLYPISNLATDATLAQIIQKVNEIIAVLVNRGVARIQ